MNKCYYKYYNKFIPPNYMSQYQLNYSSMQDKEKLKFAPSLINSQLGYEYPSAYQLPIYSNGWSIYLELLLLDALSSSNENWYEVQKYLNCTFSIQAIRDHYYSLYGSHASGDQYILPPNQSLTKMFIEQPQFHIYTAAQKRQQHLNSQLEKKNRQKQRADLQNLKIRQKTLKIPKEFGYEPYKKLFTQPYNQQAEIMIINLKIDPCDSEQTKQNKIFLLRKYNQMIKQRQVVQKQTISNGLMECRYSLTRDNLNIKIPSDIKVNQSNVRNQTRNNDRIRNQAKNKSTLKEYSNQKDKGRQDKIDRRSKYAKDELFFRIKRSFNEDFDQDLYVVYMKLKKFDQTGRMKKLLKQYQQKCEQAALLKAQLQAQQ